MRNGTRTAAGKANSARGERDKRRRGSMFPRARRFITIKVAIMSAVHTDREREKKTKKKQ